MLSRGVTPLTLFEVDDHYGVDGLISRVDFKNGLRKMGFHLVDDDEVPVGAAALDHRGAREDPPHELLNDSVGSHGSNDEILAPTSSLTQHSESKSTIISQAKKNQEQFKEKMADLQARSNKASALNAAQEHGEPLARAPSPVTQMLTLYYFTPKLSQLNPKMYPSVLEARRWLALLVWTRCM
jgi:hypothetical protein